MGITFQGRPVLPGTAQAEARVSRRGFNTYASFFKSLYSGSGGAVCADSGNPDLFGKDLACRILCVPRTTGSTSSGAVWLRLAALGKAPVAVLFSQAIDPLAAAGLVVAHEWGGGGIVVVDDLGEAFLDGVSDGDLVAVERDGTVSVRGGSSARFDIV